MKLYGDGWYARKVDAEEQLLGLAKLGAIPVGVVENVHGTFGTLYWSQWCIYESHEIESEGSAFRALIDSDEMAKD